MNKQDKIVEILCHRDGITVKEAEALVKLTIEELEDAAGDYDAAEDIMMNNLGLEMDYIFDLLM